VAMDQPAFGVSGEMVCTVDVLDDADFHAPTRIAQDLNGKMPRGAFQAIRGAFRLKILVRS
jgi:hypothetical protein